MIAIWIRRCNIIIYISYAPYYRDQIEEQGAILIINCTEYGDSVLYKVLT